MMNPATQKAIKIIEEQLQWLNEIIRDIKQGIDSGSLEQRYGRWLSHTSNLFKDMLTPDEYKRSQSKVFLWINEERFIEATSNKQAYLIGLIDALKRNPNNILTESFVKEASERIRDASIILVVHGRNERARTALFQFLRSLHLKPLEWSQAVRATGKPAPYIGEVLDAAFSMAQAVVVLMTPDDFAYLRDGLRQAKEPPHETEPTLQARPNVLFEAGMAMGRHPDRTILIELGELRPFSDVGGRHTIRINNTTQKRQDLTDRLEIAGCPIDITGRDWHTAGDFDAALEGL